VTVKLNERAYEHAKRLIEEGKFIDDERDAWSDHHPSTQTENEFIEKNGFSEYSKWFLAVNDEYSEDSRRHYEFVWRLRKRPLLWDPCRIKPGWPEQILRCRKGSVGSTGCN
jgi:hypothetical protein